MIRAQTLNPSQRDMQHPRSCYYTRRNPQLIISCLSGLPLEIPSSYLVEFVLFYFWGHSHHGCCWLGTNLAVIEPDTDATGQLLYRLWAALRLPDWKCGQLRIFGTGAAMHRHLLYDDQIKESVMVGGVAFGIAALSISVRS